MKNKVKPVHNKVISGRGADGEVRTSDRRVASDLKATPRDVPGEATFSLSDCKNSSAYGGLALLHSPIRDAAPCVPTGGRKSPLPPWNASLLKFLIRPCTPLGLQSRICLNQSVVYGTIIGLVWFLYIASPQKGDLRLSGSTSGQGAGGKARTRGRMVPADLRADSSAKP
ncbi:hypothetical protein PoB_003984200 [Plakobranchus ocellatus]|uniref:Uncharacterized protein n=1 Tax=Plakobranchus ocellatus TaxID=259542 RepID=A0AAV4B2L6_9GAST|nr:hypothetical protein PoB_003984200 [Plakobranchus ocellatus]